MNPRKNKPTLLEKLVFLETLRDHGSRQANEELGFTTEEGEYYRRQLKVHVGDKDEISRAIYKLENTRNGASDYPYRNYKKQEKCKHENFKLMLKCACSKVLSENDIDELIDILERKREKLKVGVRVFDLTGNKVIN